MLTHLSIIIESLVSDFLNLRPAIPQYPLWAFNEFAGADFNDLRLTERLQYLARDFERQPMASIPQACGNWAASKAAYRFWSNPKVSFYGILAPHFANTIERAVCDSSKVILCPQDTTTLNYMAHPATQGLGHVGTKPGRSLGMLLHSTLAVSPEGRFHGIVGAHCWARPKPKKKSKRSGGKKKNIQEKETARWLESYRNIERLAQLHPQYHWVSVADREGDIYEVIREATAPKHLADLLVRARHDRSILAQPGMTLFKHVSKHPTAGNYVVHLPRDQNQAARDATLRVGFDLVSFESPGNHAKEAPITLWVVWAREINPPAGSEPIFWCLLSTAPVHTLADAIERIKWYVKRWVIEEFHRVLKSGCKVEERQLTTRERLERSLALDMVVAWRIMDINRAARLEPQAAADQWLCTQEWQALYCYVNKTAVVPKEVPSIFQTVGWIAQLGGFLGRKRDGHPGDTTLWRGIHRLNDIVRSWETFGPERQSIPLTPNG